MVMRADKGRNIVKRKGGIFTIWRVNAIQKTAFLNDDAMG